MVTVVGIGPGHPDYITPAAQKHIATADVLIGGKRLLDSVDTAGKDIYYITGHIDSALEELERCKDKNTVVVVSGDPGFYSILRTIRTRLPDLSINAIPGISSVQVLFALIGQEWQDVVFTSVHGRSTDELDKVTGQNKKVCLLTDDKLTAPAIARHLRERGVGGRAVVGKNLSYPNQEIIDTTVDALAAMKGLESCVLYIEAAIGD
ncbi:MAG: precorrin-6y C5,15-methyltransferase (decarboxylating) subunit CbiE [Candidatus Aquicultor sp.]